MSKSDAETQSWLSFDTSKSERTYSPGNSSYGDPGNADHGALEDPSTSLDEFHSPNKETFGDLLSMVVVEPNLRPRFSSFDEESFLRSKVQEGSKEPDIWRLQTKTVQRLIRCRKRRIQLVMKHPSFIPETVD